MTRLSVKLFAIWLAASVSITPAQTPSVPPSDHLVMIGPDGPIKEQVRYLVSTWPDKFAVAVVEALEDPQCHRIPKGPVNSGRITYCAVRVRPVELIVARWQDRPPQAWGDPFEMNYWFPREDKPQDTVRFEVSKGNRLVALLAPTRTGKPIYSCDYLAHATESLVDSVRQAVTEVLRR